jgi:SH3-like domain-containing protein
VTLKATPRSNGVANVRWAPSKKSKLLKAYPSGSQVKVIAELDKWYQVQDPVTGETGFVNTAYVQR